MEYCSFAVSLQGRCCRKLFDQIVTMTGKQPGRIFAPLKPIILERVTPSRRLSICLRWMIISSWLTRQAALTDCSQISSCSSRCWLISPQAEIWERPFLGGKNNEWGNEWNQTVCRRDKYSSYTQPLMTRRVSQIKHIRLARRTVLNQQEKWQRVL